MTTLLLFIAIKILKNGLVIYEHLREDTKYYEHQTFLKTSFSCVTFCLITISTLNFPLK